MENGIEHSVEKTKEIRKFHFYGKNHFFYTGVLEVSAATSISIIGWYLYKKWTKRNEKTAAEKNKVKHV